MSKNYRVVFECYGSESNENLSKTIIANGLINLPADTGQSPDILYFLAKLTREDKVANEMIEKS